MAAENIQVVVRVRPFNDREKSRKAMCIVKMEGKKTMLFDPSHMQSKPKDFIYDYSYWSHDGYKVDGGFMKPTSSAYVDQEKIFKDLGHGMLDNAWKGYNCSIFAYGQTGSGKSYSIMGHGVNKGLVPRICEKLFEEMGSRKQDGVQVEVSFSMLEIYNENVRDLLNKKKTPSGGLPVREKPGKGFYVEGLSSKPVGSYKDIEFHMREGEKARTIAATKMNDTSSRAHTIVTIQLNQVSVKLKTTKVSTINLVDLAGSERAKQTEATGDRFEEAKNINKSLMTLGTVIHELCEQARLKKTSGHIPYRDAVLTKLMKNALGGNSKTTMIAAISPDRENYEQTLSTLRYADRAKSIKTDAKVNNEDASKVIKELIQEKERLLEELKGLKGSKSSGISDEDIKRMQEEKEIELRRYKEQMTDMEKFWQQRLEDARNEMQGQLEREKQQEEAEKKLPHLSNLNDDTTLCGRLVYICKEGTSLIGNGREGVVPEILLGGPRITKEHARTVNTKGKVKLEPIHGQLLHNGKEITSPVELRHQDRLRFGSSSLFVFIDPKEAESMRKKGKQPIDVTYEYAQSEIAKYSGISVDSEDGLLQEEVMNMMQYVNDVNGMAEDLDKTAEFGLVLVSAEARGLEGARTEVFIKMKDLNTENEYLWHKHKFLNRKVLMEEMYQKYDESGEVPSVSKQEDPFWDPFDTEVLVGVVTVPLKFLSHMIEFQDEPLTIIDYQAKQIGYLKVDLVPCDPSGKEDVDLTVEEPMDLVGRNVSFKIKIHQGMNLPEKIATAWCRYKFYQDTEYVTTDKGKKKKVPTATLR